MSDLSDRTDPLDVQGGPKHVGFRNAVNLRRLSALVPELHLSPPDP